MLEVSQAMLLAYWLKVVLKKLVAEKWSAIAGLCCPIQLGRVKPQAPRYVLEEFAVVRGFAPLAPNLLLDVQSAFA